MNHPVSIVIPEIYNYSLKKPKKNIEKLGDKFRLKYF